MLSFDKFLKVFEAYETYRTQSSQAVPLSGQPFHNSILPPLIPGIGPEGSDSASVGAGMMPPAPAPIQEPTPAQNPQENTPLDTGDLMKSIQALTQAVTNLQTPNPQGPTPIEQPQGLEDIIAKIF